MALLPAAARICGAAECSSLFASEWSFDGQALANDGQYWRSVFGGSRLVLGTVRCHAPVYFAMRLILLLLMLFLLGVESFYHPFDSDWMLTFGHWTLVAQCAYFFLACMLTLVAVYTPSPGIARTTPTLVRLTELLYGVALPASAIAFFVALLVTWSQAPYCISRIDAASAAPEVEVWLHAASHNTPTLRSALCAPHY